MTQTPNLSLTETVPPSDFVDTHIHLWRLTGQLDYGWLDAADGGMLGAISEARIANWDAERFNRETRFLRPAKTVHVQATDAPSDPVDETRWLVAEQDAHGLPTAIVGRADLRSDAVVEVLDAHRAASSTFCGVRDMSTMGSIADPALKHGLAELERLSLSWEASCTWEEFSALKQLASDFPDLTIVLGHMGWPMERSHDYFACWSAALADLAEADNVVCKVSGLGMTDHEWTAASIRPYLDLPLQAFGADRCMFGSNWPVDRIYASYETLVRSVAHLTDQLSVSEYRAFWSGTATRIYNL